LAGLLQQVLLKGAADTLPLPLGEDGKGDNFGFEQGSAVSLEGG
jgi:hypothetical protein